MKLYKDIRNNNCYLLGELRNKTYLFNGIYKFELTDKRKEHLIEVADKETLKELRSKVKKHLKFDYTLIKFI